MSVGSGLALLSVPAALAVVGGFFTGTDAVIGATIVGCVGFVQVARVIRDIEHRKRL